MHNMNIQANKSLFYTHISMYIHQITTYTHFNTFSTDPSDNGLEALLGIQFQQTSQLHVYVKEVNQSSSILIHTRGSSRARPYK